MPPTSANGPSSGRAREQLLLDAPADLQLLAQALLLEEALLVPAQVAGQEVERLRQVPELAAVGHRHAHVEVAGGEPPRPVGERGDVAGHPVRQRQDAEERRARASPRPSARLFAAVRRISCRAGPTGRATAITMPVSGSRRSATTHSPASRRVTGLPGTCPRAASTASSAGVGRVHLARRRRRAKGMAPCRRSAPERIARSSSRSSSPSAAASASRRAFWYGALLPGLRPPPHPRAGAPSARRPRRRRASTSRAARSPASAATAWRKARSEPSQV